MESGGEDAEERASACIPLSTAGSSEASARGREDPGSSHLSVSDSLSRPRTGHRRSSDRAAEPQDHRDVSSAHLFGSRSRSPTCTASLVHGPIAYAALRAPRLRFERSQVREDLVVPGGTPLPARRHGEEPRALQDQRIEAMGAGTLMRLRSRFRRRSQRFETTARHPARVPPRVGASPRSASSQRNLSAFRSQDSG